MKISKYFIVVILFILFFVTFSPILSFAATAKIANPCFTQWICDPLGYGVKKASVEFSGLSAGDLSKDCMNRCLFGETNTPSDREGVQKDPLHQYQTQTSSTPVVLALSYQQRTPVGVFEYTAYETDTKTGITTVKEKIVFKTRNPTLADLEQLKTLKSYGYREVFVDAETHVEGISAEAPGGRFVSRELKVRYTDRPVEFLEKMKGLNKFDKINEVGGLLGSEGYYPRKLAQQVVDESDKRIVAENALRAGKGENPLTSLEKDNIRTKTRTELNKNNGLSAGDGKEAIRGLLRNRIASGKPVAGKTIGSVGGNALILLFDVGFSTGPELWGCKMQCDREIQKMLKEVEEGKCKSSDISLNPQEVQILAYNIDPSRFEENRQFESSAVMRNIGFATPEQNIGVAAVLVGMDDTIYDTQQITILKSQLYPGGLYTFHNIWSGVPSGTYRVWYSVGGDDQTIEELMKECNYGNNIAAREFDVFVVEPLTQPDLVGGNIKILGVQQSDASESFTVSFNAFNRGSGGVLNSEVMIKFSDPTKRSGDVIERIKINSLPGSSSQKIEKSFTIYKATHPYISKLEIIFDSDNKITEADENNNKIEIENFRRPDFQVTEIKTMPDDPVALISFSATITVKNIGYPVSCGGVGNGVVDCIISLSYGKQLSQKVLTKKHSGYVGTGETFEVKFEDIKLYNGDQTLYADTSLSVVNRDLSIIWNILIPNFDLNKENDYFSKLVYVSLSACQIISPIIVGPQKAKIGIRTTASVLAGQKVDYSCGIYPDDKFVAGRSEGTGTVALNNKLYETTYIWCDYKNNFFPTIYTPRIRYNSQEVCSAPIEVLEPDFAVEDIVLEKKPAVGEQNSIQPTIVNYGVGAKYDFEKQQGIDIDAPIDVFVNDEKISSIEKYTAYLTPIKWTPKKSGWNTISISLDPQKTIAEYDRNNNIFSKQFYVKIPADIELSDISFSTGGDGNKFPINEKISIGVDVFRIGDDKLTLTKPAAVEVYVDRILIGVGKVPAGTYDIYGYRDHILHIVGEWTPKSVGLHEIKAKLLASDGLKQKEISTLVTVEAPDISISKDDIQFNHPIFGTSVGKIETIYVGDTIFIESNTRSSKYFDEIYLKTYDGAGQTKLLFSTQKGTATDQRPFYSNINWRFQSKGFRYLEFETGATKPLAESSTTNNKITIPLTISFPPYKVSCDTPFTLDNTNYAATIVSSDKKISNIVIRSYAPSTSPNPTNAKIEVIRQTSDPFLSQSEKREIESRIPEGFKSPPIDIIPLGQAESASQTPTNLLKIGEKDFFLGDVIIKILDSTNFDKLFLQEQQSQGQSAFGDIIQTTTLLVQCPANTDLSPISFKILDSNLTTGNTVQFGAVFSEKLLDPEAGERTVPQYTVKSVFEKTDMKVASSTTKQPTATTLQQPTALPSQESIVTTIIKKLFDNVGKITGRIAAWILGAETGSAVQHGSGVVSPQSGIKEIELNKVFSGNISEHIISTSSLSEFSGAWMLPKESGIYKIKIEVDKENAVRESESTRTNNKFETLIEIK